MNFLNWTAQKLQIVGFLNVNVNVKFLITTPRYFTWLTIGFAPSKRYIRSPEDNFLMNKIVFKFHNTTPGQYWALEIFFITKLQNFPIMIIIIICSNSTDGSKGRRITIFQILFYKYNNHCNMYIVCCSACYNVSWLWIKELGRQH